MKNSTLVKKGQAGFTLIELLVVIGIIAVLAAIVLIAINPARQFAQSRDAQRWSDVNAILNAYGQSLADGKGTACATIPATAAEIKTAAGGVDLSCLVPTYLSKMPVDPETGTWTSDSDFATGYDAVRDATSGRITISATPEVATDISVTR